MKRELRKPENKSTKNTKAALSGLFGGSTGNECTVNQTNCVPGCSCAPAANAACPSLL